MSSSKFHVAPVAHSLARLGLVSLLSFAPLLAACGGPAPDDSPIDTASQALSQAGTSGQDGAGSSGTSGASGEAGAGGSTASCECQGTGQGNVPVTVACGQSTCGYDGLTYNCVDQQQWQSTGQSCSGGGTPDCTCQGTGAGNQPVTVACGQSTCGYDGLTYNCVSQQNWQGTGQACSGGSTPDCTCQGTGQGNVPVTVACGQSTCGYDGLTYNCVGQQNWQGTGQSCAGGGTPDCTCQGTGYGNVPITKACGETACGYDGLSYSCVGQQNWQATGNTCSGDCECQGIGPGNQPITAACGQSACGYDGLSYSCVGPQQWQATGKTCSGTPSCECQGTGAGYQPITVACGQSACGYDGLTYDCVGQQNWQGTGQACSGTP